MLHRRTGFLVLFAIITIVGLCAQADDRALFDDTVDFSMSLEQMHLHIEAGDFDALFSGRAVIMDGVVAGITVLDPEPGTFFAQIDLVTGRWIDLQEVRLYRAYVFVQGPEFADLIPVTPSREPNPEHLTVNSRVIVAGMVVDLFDDDEGNPSPIIDGFHLRPIR